MKLLISTLIATLCLLGCGRAQDISGLISIESSKNVKETSDKLESVLVENGMTVFTRINHAAGASKADMKLRPTELFIFGNPKVGTQLMNCDQRMGIELPLKILVWESESGKIYVSYFNPTAYVDYYSLKECFQILENIKDALKSYSSSAVE